jgi:hypothetical protein
LKFAIGVFWRTDRLVKVMLSGRAPESLVRFFINLEDAIERSCAKVVMFVSKM